MIDGFAQALDATQSLEECWGVIRQHYEEFGLKSIHLCVNGVSYRDGDTDPSRPGVWLAKIPLSNTDSVEFTRGFQSTVLPMAVAPLADLLLKGLARFSKPGGEGTRSASASSS